MSSQTNSSRGAAPKHAKVAESAKKGKGGGDRKKRKARKDPLTTRMSAALVAHPVAAGALCVLFMAATIALIIWFTLFSGLSASADFIYSKF